MRCSRRLVSCAPAAVHWRCALNGWEFGTKPGTARQKLGQPYTTDLSMRVLIRPYPSIHGAEREVVTSGVRWDVAKRQFLMWQEVGDGVYDAPVECDVSPTELDVRQGELHVLVRTAEEAVRLAAALERTSAHCYRSYGRSRC